METSIPLPLIQGCFIGLWFATHDRGRTDWFGYLVRTVAVVAYTVFSWSQQEAHPSLLDWLGQSVCMIHYIRMAVDVALFEVFPRRKHG